MLSIEGHGGAVTSGSRRVAELGAWRLSRANASGDDWALEAEPLGVDTFRWATARPVRVTVAFWERRWAWQAPVLPALAARVTLELVGTPETFP